MFVCFLKAKKQLCGDKSHMASSHIILMTDKRSVSSASHVQWSKRPSWWASTSLITGSNKRRLIPTELVIWWSLSRINCWDKNHSLVGFRQDSWINISSSFSAFVVWWNIQQTGRKTKLQRRSRTESYMRVKTGCNDLLSNLLFLN